MSVHSGMAVIGGGPMAVYLLGSLLRRPNPPRAITIYEAGPEAGCGMPYDPRTTHPALLANIAPVEIPPVTQGVMDWLAVQPKDRLTGWGIDGKRVTERSFLPRVVLGAWLTAELAQLVRSAALRGIAVTLRTSTRVVDMGWDASGVTVTAVREGRVDTAGFDAAVLATGHVWPASDQGEWGRFASPWPSQAIEVPDAARVAVLGSSLSAIDVAVTLAHRNGVFRQGPDGLQWQAAPGQSLAITFLSRGGLLPEADFWCPLPYRPLAICTPAAIDAAIAEGAEGLLDRAFALMQAELALDAPDYAADIDLSELTADSFPAAYFDRRANSDPFDHAAANLDEVQANAARQTTVAWRYAILRMHEVVSAIAPHLTRADSARFSRGLKRVFVDNYAAVPAQSVQRMLALHAAGVLSVEALSPDDSLTPAYEGVVLQQSGRSRHFTTLVDARGQRPLGLAQLPFPSLLRALRRTGQRRADGALPMSDDFALPVPPGACGTVHCLALPYILYREPFAQGLTECAALADRVASSIAAPAADPAPIFARTA